MLIYKIFRSPEWDAMQADGSTAGAPVDLADGYIHFSTAETVAATTAKYFAGVEGLWLIAADSAALEADLRWEPARGTLFPHLYRPFRMDDVVWARPLPLVDGAPRFPELS
jgi:uncharacterized protein (DUF952 family)